MKVAVKSLNESAGEGERVKFLQEAAIMGQFYHPNIVRLHGVVTMGEPVRVAYSTALLLHITSSESSVVVEETECENSLAFVCLCRC